MYVLLCGTPPFEGKTEMAILLRVHHGVYNFDGAVWEDVSEDAKDLIRGLLTMDQLTRCTAQEALRHIWISRVAPRSSGKALSPDMLNNLKQFQSANKLKQAALEVIAQHLKESEIQLIRDVFVAIDSDNDGILSVEDLKTGLDSVGVSMPDLETVVREVDVEGRNVIDYIHFIAATLDAKTFCEEEVCWQAFNLFDCDQDGLISKEDIAQVLKSDDWGEFVGQQIVEEIMMEVQPVEKDAINFEEFLVMMQPHDASLSVPDGPRIRENRRKRICGDMDKYARRRAGSDLDTHVGMDGRVNVGASSSLQCCAWCGACTRRAADYVGCSSSGRCFS